MVIENGTQNYAHIHDYIKRGILVKAKLDDGKEQWIIGKITSIGQERVVLSPNNIQFYACLKNTVEPVTKLVEEEH